jgi:hypothetical protein
MIDRRYKRQEDREEGISSYWMTLRKEKIPEIESRSHGSWRTCCVWGYGTVARQSTE